MSIQRRRLLQAAAAGTAVGLAGCGDSVPDGPARDSSPDVLDDELVFGTTTSTYDSGLVDAVVPRFESAFDVTVKPIVKGTGAVLRTAADGDVDLVLVHSRGAEDAFLRAGDGVNRRDVMYNDFVVVGPVEDPAGIHGAERATAAFAAIADTASLFLSRGDDSGTHDRERSIWTLAGVDPGGTWYQETGQGQGNTLVQADERGAYTIADRGTYLAMADDLDLAVHVQGPLEGGPARLRNPYGTIPVNPAKHDAVNYVLAMAFVGFLTGPAGQALIREHAAGGSQLFVPDALTEEPAFDQYVPTDFGADEAASVSTRVAGPAGSPTPKSDP